MKKKKITTNADGIETYPAKAIGFRSWSVQKRYGSYSSDFAGDKHVLGSLTASGSPWLKGENTADCAQGYFLGHTAPNQQCSCGFYAFNNLCTAAGYSLRGGKRTILGAVTGSGKLMIHDNGWRSEKTEVVAFYLPRIKIGLSVFRSASVEEAESLARTYSVPLFRNRRKFMKYANSKGAKIPRSIKPSKSFSFFSAYTDYSLHLIAAMFSLLILKYVNPIAFLDTPLNILYWVVIGSIWVGGIIFTALRLFSGK